MNVKKSYAVIDWVGNRKQEIQSQRPPREKLAAEATSALGFKISTSAIRDALLIHGIQTRGMSKAQCKILALEGRIAELERMLIKVIVAPELPEWLRAELEESNLPAEARAALARTQRRLAPVP